MQKQKKGSQETLQRWSRVLVPAQGIYIAIWYKLWILLGELSALAQVEDGNLRLSTSTWTPDWLKPKGWWLRFLEHHPVTSPPTNQRKITHSADLPSNFAYKNSSPKTTGEFRPFEHEPPIFLAQPCNEPFSVPNYDDVLVWPHCVLGTWTWVQ